MRVIVYFLNRYWPGAQPAGANSSSLASSASHPPSSPPNPPPPTTSRSDPANPPPDQPQTPSPSLRIQPDIAAGTTSRKSQRFLWKQGDGDGKKEETHPKLYNEPPHKLVEGDETTYPPKYVELSSMWVFQIVRCPFISQDIRYQRWPGVFPSKDPLRVSWINKGLAPKVWSDVRQVWVYPIIFGKYQLHGEEGTGHFDIDQSSFIDSTGTNATHDIREGATCIVQEPPAFASKLSSDGLTATAAPSPAMTPVTVS